MPGVVVTGCSFSRGCGEGSQHVWPQGAACPWGYCFLFFFLNKCIIYFWLRWVFGAAHGLSLVAASGGYSSLRCAGLSLRWLLLLRSTGSRHAGFSSCGSWALECRLSSCGPWALLLRGMWDLPGPGLEPVSPALAGGFLTTVPPGKSLPGDISVRWASAQWSPLLGGKLAGYSSGDSDAQQVQGGGLGSCNAKILPGDSDTQQGSGVRAMEADRAGDSAWPCCLVLDNSAHLLGLV